MPTYSPSWLIPNQMAVRRRVYERQDRKLAHLQSIPYTTFYRRNLPHSHPESTGAALLHYCKAAFLTVPAATLHIFPSTACKN
jgi:hypothetical protein